MEDARTKSNEDDRRTKSKQYNYCHYYNYYFILFLYYLLTTNILSMTMSFVCNTTEIIRGIAEAHPTIKLQQVKNQHNLRR
jgi:hypothetical protein